MELLINYNEFNKVLLDVISVSGGNSTNELRVRLKIVLCIFQTPAD